MHRQEGMVLKWLTCFLFLLVMMSGVNFAQALTIGTNSASTVQLSPGFNDPAGLLFFEAANWLAWICFFIYFLRQSIRAQTLTFGMLLLISSTSIFWQDTFQAWSVYILYNPKFHLMPWGVTSWTSPNKPWFVPAGYGAFYTCSFLIVLSVITKLRDRFPALRSTAGMVIIAAPIFYVWDLLNEGSSAVYGWYSYTYYFGPAVVGSKGNFPLLYPILPLVCWVLIPIHLLTRRGPDGRVLFESWFCVERIQSGVSRELARIGVWVLMMNALYLGLTISLVIVRHLVGIPSTLVP